MSIYHQPVLLKEVIDILDPQNNENFIDCTLGGGGHAKGILSKNNNGKLLGIDLDQEAITEGKKQLADYRERIILVKDNFANLKNIVEKNSFNKVSGILLDLGVSFHQLSAAYRGFSYRLEGELDMRLGEDIEINARDFIKDVDESTLEETLKDFGEVKGAARIAKKIILYRKNQEIANTGDLKIALIGDRDINKNNIKLLSQVFQAIRIAVNNELENLKFVLEQSMDILQANGRLVVISYHSLEDRIVKKYFQQEARDCVCPDEAMQCSCDHKKRLKILTKKPITASREELFKNKKSRSAKLRAIIKI